MSKKVQIGIDLRVNVQDDGELFDLIDFSEYDFYHEFAGSGARRTRAYNVLGGSITNDCDDIFKRVWGNTSHEALRCIERFNNSVCKLESLGYTIEFVDCDSQQLSVNAELIDVYREPCVVFDVDMIYELTYTIELNDSDSIATKSKDIAEALKQHVRKELDEGATTQIAFIG